MLFLVWAVCLAMNLLVSWDHVYLISCKLLNKTSFIEVLIKCLIIDKIYSWSHAIPHQDKKHVPRKQCYSCCSRYSPHCLVSVCKNRFDIKHEFKKIWATNFVDVFYLISTLWYVTRHHSTPRYAGFALWDINHLFCFAMAYITLGLVTSCCFCFVLLCCVLFVSFSLFCLL